MLKPSAVTHLGYGIYLHRRATNESGPEFVLKIPANFTVEVAGDQIIRASGNVIRESGRGPDPRRSGYNHAIFDNCPKDENGFPRQVANLYNNKGEYVATWLGVFDKNGVPDTGAVELSFTQPSRHQHEMEDRIASLEATVASLLKRNPL